MSSACCLGATEQTRWFRPGRARRKAMGLVASCKFPICPAPLGSRFRRVDLGGAHNWKLLTLSYFCRFVLEGAKFSGTACCDESTFKVEYPPKGRSESKTIRAIEKYGSKDRQRESQVLKFFDSLSSWFFSKTQRRRDRRGKMKSVGGWSLRPPRLCVSKLLRKAKSWQVPFVVTGQHTKWSILKRTFRIENNACCRKMWGEK
jgi:hypothetical protein